MTNEEFAKGLLQSIDEITNWSYPTTSYISRINKYLTENNLQVINTKDQLLGYCSGDVASYYESNVEHYKEKYPTVPDKLTVKQSQDLLEWADRLNSKHDLGFCCDDIDEAIEEWLKENYAS